jgi:energy-coupling factor transporter ATP-binding protein EcfA2
MRFIHATDINIAGRIPPFYLGGSFANWREERITVASTFAKRRRAAHGTREGAGAAVRAAQIEAAQIELRGVTKRFVTPSGSMFTALRDVDLTIGPGKFCAVVGPTGCGKSTTLTMVAAWIAPVRARSAWAGGPSAASPPAPASCSRSTRCCRGRPCSATWPWDQCSLGLGIAAKVSLAAVLVFFVVFFNAFQGVREVDRDLLNNARVLGASRRAITRHVVIPSALTWIIASLHVAFGLAIIGAIVGEFLGAQKGLGLVIATAQNNFNPDGVFAAMFIIAVLALTAEGLIGLLERRLLSWRPPVTCRSRRRLAHQPRRHKEHQLSRPTLTKLASVASIAALAAGLAACSSSGSSSSSSTAAGSTATGSNAAAASSLPTVTLMVGGIDKQIYLPYQLAQDLGFYKKYGVNAELSTEQQGGVGAETAMVSGQVDMAGAWYVHAIDFQAKGKNVIDVVQLSGAPGEREMCAKSSGITSPAQWKGKSLGVTDIGSGTDELTLYLAARCLTTKAAYITELAQDKGQFLANGMMPASGPATVLAIEKFIGNVTGPINLATTYTNQYAIAANKLEGLTG